MELNPLAGDQVAQFLNHEDPNQDLSALFNFVHGDEVASAALDVIVYATGAAARLAYETKGRSSAIPDPVLEASPDVVVAALARYRKVRGE